jgi:hypothetical protein
MIYDGGGEALGSIAPVMGTLQWLGTPANPTTFGVPAGQALANRNPHLRAFALAMLGRGADVAYLRDFLNTLHDASTTIHPAQAAQHADVPLLVGQPLALVRAEFALDLRGRAAVNETWAAFTADLQAAGTRTTNGHEAVLYPVLLGDVNDPDDGFVGLYLESAQKPFDAFYAVAGGGKGIVPRRTQTVQVSPAGGPVTVTLLIDPRSHVQITTGYTPAQTLVVAPELIGAALRKLAVTFLTAPVLLTAPPPAAPGGVLTLPPPLPGQQQGTWKWVRVMQPPGGVQTAVIAEVKPPAPNQPLSNAEVYLQEGWLSLGDFG